MANTRSLADVLITGRGGGSLEDLWAFNDERVARAIYDSDIPVISAVGHEPDVAISDFVADRRASTPSNAAEIAVPDMAELLRTLDAARSRMTQSIRRDIAAHSRRLESLSKKRVLTDPTAYLGGPPPGCGPYDPPALCRHACGDRCPKPPLRRAGRVAGCPQPAEGPGPRLRPGPAAGRHGAP